MTDSVLDTPAVDTAQPSDLATEQPLADEQHGDTDAPEQENQSSEQDETDDQRNERVQREATERARRKSEGVQKRMNELTAEKYAERRRAEELARQNAQLMELLKGKAPGAAEADPSRANAGAAPTRDQFDSFEAFTVALARYEAQQTVDQVTREREERQRSQREQSERIATAQAFAKRQTEFATKTPDYMEVMEAADVPIPGSVASLLMGLEDGPAIAYHLAKNPALVQQLSTSPAHMHGILIGRISAALSTPAPVSKAPPPGKPVGTRPATSADNPPDDPDAYMAWAAKHLKR